MTNSRQPKSNVLADRHLIEEGFHDLRARSSRKRLSSWAYNPIFLEPARRYFFSLTEPLAGCRVLELGCGKGQMTIPLAKQGIIVEATDISDEMLAVTREHAISNGFGDRINCRRMTAERLDYPDASFAAVVGSGVLHHIDLHLAIREMCRVLIPEGRGIFIEPLGHNPILNLYRKLTPRQRTVCERPLKFENFRYFEEAFSECGHHEFHFTTLFALLSYMLHRNETRLRRAVARGLRFDEWIHKFLPVFRPFYWITIIEVKK